MRATLIIWSTPSTGTIAVASSAIASAVMGWAPTPNTAGALVRRWRVVVDGMRVSLSGEGFPGLAPRAVVRGAAAPPRLRGRAGAAAGAVAVRVGGSREDVGARRPGCHPGSGALRLHLKPVRADESSPRGGGNDEGPDRDGSDPPMLWCCGYPVGAALASRRAYRSLVQERNTPRPSVAPVCDLTVWGYSVPPYFGSGAARPATPGAYRRPLTLRRRTPTGSSGARTTRTRTGEHRRRRAAGA